MQGAALTLKVPDVDIEFRPTILSWKDLGDLHGPHLASFSNSLN
jgi:hypothetical protein